MKQIEALPQRIELDWLKEMKAKLDEQDALLKEWPFCLENPVILDMDRRNSLPDPPEPEDDATGSSK
jgi:hypothetical protein